MGASDWAKINEVFHRALAEPPERRAAFIDQACAGEAAVRAEVVSLVAAHGRAGDFIEAPTGDAAALITLAFESGESLVGQRIGHYAILRTLGEGGMGIVYLAEDTRLGRTVALKAVAPHFAGDVTRRERLRREARAAAALSHPGIATVYALEEIDDQLYIAGEYVPGETLREELGRGALPLRRVVDTAIAIADALAAAHDRGLIHRDLKPENIVRSPSGDVKILDFGLARFRDLPQPMPQLTAEGMILGTTAYMSPEQIRGHAIDFRSDLFSLGTLLYELAAGVHPFAASDPPSTIAKILETEPGGLASHLTPRGPDVRTVDELDQIIRTCLQKAPESRYRSTHALVGALERSRQGLIEAPPPARTAARLQVVEPRSQWWWQFHQAMTTLAYGALLWPLWYAREWTPGLAGLLIFLAALVAVLVAGTLRLHLWFTLRSIPSEWAGQRERTSVWIRLADTLLVIALLFAAATILTSHARVAIVLVGAAVAALLSFAIIEPATTRAAFFTAEK